MSVGANIVHENINRKAEQKNLIEAVSFQRISTISNPDLQPLDELISHKFAALRLFCTFPDMYLILQDMNIYPTLIKGRSTIESTLFYKAGMLDYSKGLVKQRIEYHFFLNNVGMVVKQDLLKQFAQMAAIKISDLGPVVHLSRELEILPPFKTEPIQLPDIVDAINSEHFFI